MEKYRRQKIEKLEEFVDGRLKPELVKPSVNGTSSDLRKNIENLEKNNVTRLRTMVNLGSEVYMQAEVPDTRRIFVDVGLGFHVDFTWSEALSYISQRVEKLGRENEDYTNRIASVKANIKMVYKGIRELIELPQQKPAPDLNF